MNKLIITTILTTAMLSTALMPTINAVEQPVPTASVLTRESWRTEWTSKDGYTFGFQHNMQQFDNDVIEITVTSLDSVYYGYTGSLGCVTFDDNYYDMSVRGKLQSDADFIVYIPQFVDTGIQYEFVKNRGYGSIDNWIAGTAFIIELTKKDNAIGSAEITAFGHELSFTNSGTNNLSYTEQIAKLESELKSKDDQIQLLKDALAIVQQELDVKNQLLNAITDNSCDVNKDGTVNVLDLLMLKRYLLGVVSNPNTDTVTNNTGLISDEQVTDNLEYTNPFEKGDPVDGLTIF